MRNPLWGDDWPQVRAMWGLDPDVVYLNHGSFGATPLEVLRAQSELRAQMEAQPVRFLHRELPSRLDDVRRELASFLGADPDGLAFVRNATTAFAAVLGSIGLEPGDEVLITDHSYEAVRLAVTRACEKAGARVVVATLSPHGGSAPEDVAAHLSPRTRLAIVDQVVSWTGALLDAAGVVRACRNAGTTVMIDGAHAPGMIDVALDEMSPDLWTGNLHKWVCAPKGAAALWVAPDLRARILPAVTSQGKGKGLFEEFDWSGTDDPTAVLAIPAALGFMGRLGWERVRAHNDALAMRGRELLADALGTEAPVSPDRQASMAAVPLGASMDALQARAFKDAFYARTSIEVPVMSLNGSAIVRMSAQVYNAPAQYELLAAELRAEASALRGGPDQAMPSNGAVAMVRSPKPASPSKT